MYVITNHFKTLTGIPGSLLTPVHVFLFARTHEVQVSRQVLDQQVAAQHLFTRPHGRYIKDDCLKFLKVS